MIPLAVKLLSETDHVGAVGLSDMALYDAEGYEEAEPVFPFKLRFAPSGEFSYPDEYTEDPMD